MQPRSRIYYSNVS